MHNMRTVLSLWCPIFYLTDIISLSSANVASPQAANVPVPEQ